MRTKTVAMSPAHIAAKRTRKFARPLVIAFIACAFLQKSLVASSTDYVDWTTSPSEEPGERNIEK
jgi:hypothetical protein